MVILLDDNNAKGLLKEDVEITEKLSKFFASVFIAVENISM